METIRSAETNAIYNLPQFKSFMNLKALPDDLRISTITITCAFETEILVDNIGKYMDLSPDNIITIKYGSGEGSIRSLSNKKQKVKKRKKKRNTFYNQVTIEVKTEKLKPINVKLFRNGSIQMTGCKSIDDCISSMIKLCKEFKKVKGIINKKDMRTIKPVHFVSDVSKSSIEDIKDICIRMINSNFNIGFKIDRPALHQVLLLKGIECIYEPCVHACVNIKFNCGGEIISIFVFESGAIIITGAKNREHIVNAYEFITKELFENFNKISKHSEIDILAKAKEIMALQ